jgi:hypothetical protein
LALPQLRAANNTPNDEKASGTAAKKSDGPATPDKKVAPDKSADSKPVDDSIYHFSVVIARHVMLLEGKRIVTWPEIEAIIRKRDNPSQTRPEFYFTHGAYETDRYNAAKEEIWRLHGTYKLAGHSEGSMALQASWRYDQIKTANDLKTNQSQAVEGVVVDTKQKPVAGAEIVLITPLDKSISYRTCNITLVDGHVYNSIEYVMAVADQRGRFKIYPPKNQDFTLLAFHPDRGMGYSGRTAIPRDDYKITLLAWSGLDVKFSREAEDQWAMLTTHIRSADKIADVEISQGREQAEDKSSAQAFRFYFKRVPPISNTSVSRGFPGKNGSSYGLPGVSVELMPGETRELDLGKMSRQQKEFLEQIRRSSEERWKKSQAKMLQNDDGHRNAKSPKP